MTALLHKQTNKQCPSMFANKIWANNQIGIDWQPDGQNEHCGQWELH